MTLTQLINDLLAIRDTDPSRGDQSVFVFDGSGEISNITMVDDTISDRIDINIEN